MASWLEMSGGDGTGQELVGFEVEDESDSECEFDQRGSSSGVRRERTVELKNQEGEKGLSTPCLGWLIYQILFSLTALEIGF